MTLPPRLLDSIGDPALLNVLQSSRGERPSRRALARTGAAIGVFSASLSAGTTAACALGAAGGAGAAGAAGAAAGVAASTASLGTVLALGAKSAAVGVLVIAGSWGATSWVTGNEHVSAASARGARASEQVEVTKAREGVALAPRQGAVRPRELVGTSLRQEESSSAVPLPVPPPRSVSGAATDHDGALQGRKIATDLPVQSAAGTSGGAQSANLSVPPNGHSSPHRVTGPSSGWTAESAAPLEQGSSVAAFGALPKPPLASPTARPPSSRRQAEDGTGAGGHRSVAPASLGDEVAMLDSARRALLEGRVASAQAILDEYDREPNSGALNPEATVLKVQALLAAGKRQEALHVAREALRRTARGRHREQLQQLIRQTR